VLQPCCLYHQEVFIVNVHDVIKAAAFLSEENTSVDVTPSL